MKFVVEYFGSWVKIISRTHPVDSDSYSTCHLTRKQVQIYIKRLRLVVLYKYYKRPSALRTRIKNNNLSNTILCTILFFNVIVSSKYPSITINNLFYYLQLIFFLNKQRNNKYMSSQEHKLDYFDSSLGR